MTLQASDTTWLACQNGLIKCASSELFTLEKNPFLCILVHITLEVSVYNREEGGAHLNLDSGLSPAQQAVPFLLPCWLEQASWAPLLLELQP